MTDRRAEYMALMHHPRAVDAVRARMRRDGRILRIPLYCSGNRTGVAAFLTVNNEIPYSGPEEKWDVQSVPDFLDMWTGPDPTAHRPGTAERSVAPGQSYTIGCAACGRSIRRNSVELLRKVIELVVKGGVSGPGNGWRVSLT